ncbi:hypothetical protein AN218_06320 [Streptomyces nanshensis]|uniref:ABC transporter ATP-binding protein n=1 Tax=Streptomyces nanshensis TaxID=518642 RepID=A0A1E7L9R3_9ACTN|nr:hypothetical protein AN218_06320 [Streptomyces nanshensis]
MLLTLLTAVLGPLLAPHDPGEVVGVPYAPADGELPLGTDKLGADVLSRVLSGGRSLLLASCAVMVTAYAVGAVAGATAALRRGWVDSVIMRAVDVLMSMPAFMLLSVLIVATGRGWTGVAVAATLILLPDIARVVRAATLQALEHDYVEVAQGRGEGLGYVLLREVLPNLRPLLRADAGVRFVGAVFTLATAGFLGYGVQPPAADWSLMLLENQSGLALQPLAVLAPALMLLVLLLSANLLVDQLSPAADDCRPRTRSPRGGDAPSAPAEEPADDGTDGAVRARGLLIESATGPVLYSVDLDLAPRQILALVGESGSGKTTLALAVLGRVRPGLRQTGGTVTVAGKPVTGLGERALRRLRAQHTAYVPQDPRTSLSPTLRVGRHLTELLAAGGVPAQQREQRAREALRLVGLPDDARFLRRRPHQLSGGQRQRVAIAGALAGRPDVLVLDEPTSALDPVTAAALLADLDRLRRETGVSVLMVTHDLAAAAGVADTIAVMAGGRIVETGPAERLLHEAASDAGADLVTAARAASTLLGDEAGERSVKRRSPHLPDPRGTNADDVLATRSLGLMHGPRGVPVLSEVNLAVAAGSCLTLVGPSGCGKTTLLRCLAGLHGRRTGEVLLDGAPLAPRVRERSREELRMVQLVPQDPYDSLNPSHTVEEILARPLRLFCTTSDAASTREEARRLLDRVGLEERFARRRPSSLSGGQRQRVALARALAARPRVLLCDEATSALDPTAAASVVDLLGDVRRDSGTALIVVTHDLTVASRLGGDVAVLGEGGVLEYGPVAGVLADPRHPASRELISAVPELP